MNAEIDVTQIRIETERLILRPWNWDDLDDFYEYASVPGVGEMAGWPHHEDKEETKRILTRFIEGKKTFALVYKDNNKVIGSLGVEFYKLEEKLSEFFDYRGRELGYILSKDYWGKGLMPEAVKAVIDYLFGALDYDFLLSSHYEKNHRSARVQEKCGFIPYRKIMFDTQFDTKEPGIIMLLINPSKAIDFKFSHPETLLIER